MLTSGMGMGSLRPRKPKRKNKLSVGKTAETSKWFSKRPDTSTTVQKTTMDIPTSTSKPSLKRATGGKKLNPTVNKLTNATITPKPSSSSTMASAQRVAAKLNEMSSSGGSKDITPVPKNKQKSGKLKNSKPKYKKL